MSNDSLATYEPQWGSDVFDMYQYLVEDREVPSALMGANGCITAESRMFQNPFAIPAGGGDIR